MLKHQKLTYTFAILALASTGLAAVNSVAGLANPLDNSGASARATGMGSAFVGVADDSSALFWNAAGLAGLKRTEVALHHNSWLGGLEQETLVLGLPMGELGGFGLSGNYVNYGTLAGYDNSGTRVADYSVNRFGLGLGWGRKMMTDLSAGIVLKGSMQTIASTSYSAFSADLGALWTPIEHLRLGVTYSNLGTAVAGYALASALRLGASYHLELARTNTLLLAVSGALEPGGVNRLQIGAEDWLYSLVALRLGYQVNLVDNQIEGLTGLSAGLGVRFRGIGLDYAYLPFGDLGMAQRISLSYEFGAGETSSR